MFVIHHKRDNGLCDSAESQRCNIKRPLQICLIGGSAVLLHAGGASAAQHNLGHELAALEGLYSLTQQADSLVQQQLRCKLQILARTDQPVL